MASLLLLFVVDVSKFVSFFFPSIFFFKDSMPVWGSLYAG